jgi:flagellar hook-associated protein FlgK
MQVTLTATQTQANGNFSMTWKARLTKENKGKFLGTLLNDLFTWMSLQKKHKPAEGFKTNDVCDIRLNIDGKISLDTAAIRRSSNDVLRILRTKLRIKYTARGKKNFALLLNDIFSYMTREQEQITFEELIDRLTGEVIIEAANAVKIVEAANEVYETSQI